MAQSGDAMSIHRVWIEKLTFGPQSETSWDKLYVLMIFDGPDSGDYATGGPVYGETGYVVDKPPMTASMEPRTDDDPLRLAERALAVLRKAGGKS